MSVAITLSHIQVVYQQQALFVDLSLRLPAGQCTCLLGGSGTGKSSLLRLLAGLSVGAEQVQYTVTTSDGQPLTGRIAYLAQQDALLPWLTVLDNVFMSLSLRNLPITQSDIQRAKQLLQAVGLAAAHAKKPAQLSGGMRQRAALARVLFEDQPIVLLDEPFAAIDAVTRWRLQALTTQLLANKTLVWVTHDPIEAVRVAQHIKVLGGCPAQWRGELNLPLPLPRDFKHPQFIDWHTQLLAYLNQAMPDN